MSVYVLIPTAISAALIVLGLWLVLRGLWPRRRGGTPYCKACGYNLTGIERVRCPECGRELSPKAVVFGERVRRPRRIALGAIFLLLGLAPVAVFGVGSRRKANWYAHLPTSWLIFLSERANDDLGGKPWSELEARVRSGRMTRKDVSVFVEMCLRQLAAHEMQIELRKRTWRSLSTLQFVGALSQEHENKILDYVELHTGIELAVRRRARQGQGVPANLDVFEQGDMYSYPAYCDLSITRNALCLDQKAIEDVTDGKEIARGLRMLRFLVDSNWLLEAPAVGTHELSCQVDLTFYTLSSLSQTVVPARKRKKTLKAEFTVVPETEPDGIILRRRPELDDGVKQRVCLEGFEARLGLFELGRRHLEGWICIVGLPPIDLAFQIVARIDGEDHALGFVTLSRTGESLPWFIIPIPRTEQDNPVAWRVGTESDGDKRRYQLRFPLEYKKPRRVDLVLWASKEAAMRTVDMWEIWGGELRFEDVLGRQTVQGVVGPLTRGADKATSDPAP